MMMMEEEEEEVESTIHIIITTNKCSGRRKEMMSWLNLKRMDCILRVFSIPFAIAAVWLTSTNHQDNLSYGPIHFSNFLSLRYMVCVSGVSASYSLASALASRVEAVVAKPWLFFLPDQMVAYMMVTSAAAVLNFLYLAYDGDQDVTWSEACSSYAAFCNRTRLALILHSAAIPCFFVLAVISAYRTFRDFDPPHVPAKDDEEE